MGASQKISSAYCRSYAVQISPKYIIPLNFNLFQFAKMSRKTRLYDPGTLCHVLRGNGDQRIFFDDSDSRSLYQSSIGNLQQSGKWQMLSIEMILLSVVACIS